MPRGSTLTLTICKERTACLTRSDESDNGTHVPYFALVESGAANPVAFYSYDLTAVDCSELGAIHTVVFRPIGVSRPAKI